MAADDAVEVGALEVLAARVDGVALGALGLEDLGTLASAIIAHTMP